MSVVSALDAISVVTTLLEQWKEKERLHESPIETLERLVIRMALKVHFQELSLIFI